MPSKEVRDPIHGLIELRPEEWAVINTTPFQRLRGIQQLAMTHLVYPGARHSRFEHCVGVAHVAGRLATSVELGEAETQRVRMAGLAHDLGHGPFSHVSEDVFERLTGRENVHESISAAIARHHPDIRAAMGDEMAEWVADILSEQGQGARRSVERDTVAGPADADKLDYLLRDSHYCGVTYGKFDLDKVVESALVITERFGPNTYLGFHLSGIYALEEMLLARYHMHRQVYGHRTRIATDRMLVRAIDLGLEEGLLPVELFQPPDEPELEFLNFYLSWNDARVVATLAVSESPAGEVMRSLVERQILKQVVTYDFDRLVHEFDRPSAGHLAKPSDEVLRDHLAEAEAIVATAAGVAPHWVSIHWADIESPISSQFSFKIQGKEILIEDDDGETREFNETSEVFADTELPGRVRVSVFVRLPQRKSPVDLSEEEREQVAKGAHEALTVIARAEAAA